MEGAGAVPMPAISHPFICPDASSSESSQVLQQQSHGLGRARRGGAACVDTWRDGWGVLGVRSSPTKSPREQGRV